MTAHPKAALLAELTEVAKTNEKPWEEFESRYPKDAPWIPFFSLTDLVQTIEDGGREIRRKLRTIKINGYDVPEPLREAPKIGSEYFVADPLTSGNRCCTWAGSVTEYRYLKVGLIHLISAAAQTHIDALLSFTRRDEE